jgi:hypothetical protein
MTRASIAILSALGMCSVFARAADWESHPVNTWVRQSPRPDAPAPRFQYEGSGAFDPFSRKWIHYGGHDGVPQGFHLFTWDADSGKWDQRFPDTSPPGVCCIDGANVFDPVNRRFVRFPGGMLGHGWQFSRGEKLAGSHVWLYDVQANTWMNMRPPPYQEPEKYSRATLGALNAGATYDSNHELAISFGGQTAGGGTNALFTYDAYSNRLEAVKAAGPPSERDGMAVAYDTTNDCLVVFGSQYGSDEKTWFYRHKTNRWEGVDLNPRPPGKKAGTYSTIPRAAFDSRNNVVLCLTWDTNTSAHQTWVLDVGAMKWTKMNPPAEPTPSMSRSRNLSYWPGQNVFLLELSAKGKDGGPEIWSYRYKNVEPEKRPAPPSNLAAAAGRFRNVGLAWDKSAGAASYNVYRARADRLIGAEFVKIGTIKDTGFADVNLEPGKPYFYSVAAVSADGVEGPRSHTVRNEPRVLIKPVVSVLAADRVEATWNKHPAPDVVGYNVYRGLATVHAVKKGTPSAWRDNDPEYREPLVCAVRDITGIVKLNDAPIADTTFTDAKIDLNRKGPESGEYRFAVYAYIVRAVNAGGLESGPSPYALTIPSAPRHVLLREGVNGADIKWAPNPEKGIAGYRLYRTGKGVFEIARLGEDVKVPTFTDGNARGLVRYWVTAVDALGQEGEPSVPVWFGKSYKGYYAGDWHQ